MTSKARRRRWETELGLNCIPKPRRLRHLYSVSSIWARSSLERSVLLPQIVEQIDLPCKSLPDASFSICDWSVRDCRQRRLRCAFQYSRRWISRCQLKQLRFRCQRSSIRLYRHCTGLRHGRICSGTSRRQWRVWQSPQSRCY